MLPSGTLFSLSPLRVRELIAFMQKSRSISVHTLSYTCHVVSLSVSFWLNWPNNMPHITHIHLTYQTFGTTGNRDTHIRFSPATLALSTSGLRLGSNGMGDVCESCASKIISSHHSHTHRRLTNGITTTSASSGADDAGNENDAVPRHIARASFEI